jgi:hypothetical protein
MFLLMVVFILGFLALGVAVIQAILARNVFNVFINAFCGTIMLAFSMGFAV